jgi:hypothetical protein
MSKNTILAIIIFLSYTSVAAFSITIQHYIHLRRQKKLERQKVLTRQ